MPHHIGIVACSADGAALCDRTICDTNSPLPTLDSTRLLAPAALRRAVQGAAAVA